MKNFFEIFKSLEEDQLTFETILWCRFAEEIGLDPFLINTQVISNEVKKAYFIRGFIWKYVTIPETMLNFFDNELLVKLEEDPFFFEIGKDTTTEVIENLPETNSHVSSLNTFISLPDTNSYLNGYLTGYQETETALISNYISDEITKLNQKLKHGKILNGNLEDTTFQYISLTELINEYHLPNNCTWTTNIKTKPKFKICLV